jgi:hypothetical protein
MFKNAKINLLIASLFSLSAYAADLTTDKIEVISQTPLPSLGVSINQLPSNVQTVKASDLKKSQSLDISSYINENLSGININENQSNLTDAEKKWLESIISYADNYQGFEPNDIEMKDSIFSKLGIGTKNNNDGDTPMNWFASRFQTGNTNRSGY